MASRMSVRAWTALKTVQARANAEVRLTSPENGSDAVAVGRFRLGRMEVMVPALGGPRLGINYGEPFMLECLLDGRRMSRSATPGQLSILPPDCATRWFFDRKGDVVVVCLARKALDDAIACGRGRDPGSAEIVPRFLTRDLVLEGIAHRLLREVCEPSPESALAVDMLAQALAVRLVAAHCNLAGIAVERRHAIAPGRLRRAQEYMRSNLARRMSLREIAGAAGMSAFHFARGFKLTTGMPPHRYLTEQRLAEARALLHNPRLSVGEVARAVGLTHSHFTVVFAHHLGMTPSRFRDVLHA